MKVAQLDEKEEKYFIIKEICDFCSEEIETDNIKINHIFTDKSIIAPGQKIELDICEKCFIETFIEPLKI
jgi:hypothetical protein